MKGWTRSLSWEGVPLLILAFVFGSLCLLNWQYEAKLFTPAPREGAYWSEVYLGPIMLAIACAMTLIGCAILLLLRLVWPGITKGYPMLLSLLLVTFFLIFPSVFIVVLGPADITMMEQMRKVPELPQH